MLTRTETNKKNKKHMKNEKFSVNKLKFSSDHYFLADSGSANCGSTDGF